VTDTPVLHTVTDDTALADDAFESRAIAVLELLGARGALHLRGHGTSGRRLYQLAHALHPVAARTGSWLVINDRVDVALAAGVTCVQLGGGSLDAATVRTLPGTTGWRLGVSVHSSEAAARASAAGASWVLAGHVFDTATHAGDPGRGLAFVSAVRAATTLPLIAIGGIAPRDVRDVLAAGADGIAVLGQIWGQPDPAAASATFLAEWR